MESDHESPGPWSWEFDRGGPNEGLYRVRESRPGGAVVLEGPEGIVADLDIAVRSGAGPVDPSRALEARSRALDRIEALLTGPEARAAMEERLLLDPGVSAERAAEAAEEMTGSFRASIERERGRLAQARERPPPRRPEGPLGGSTRTAGPGRAGRRLEAPERTGEGDMETRVRWVAAAAVMAVGLALGGWLVGRGFTESRVVDRFVTVKGVSEREVEADLALWPLQVIVTDDDLGRAQAGIREATRRVYAFLVDQGIDTAQAELQGLRVNDLLANPYRTGPTDSRFIITRTIMVRSGEPYRIQAASQRVGDLVESGVVLQEGPEYGPGGPTFLFTGLNDLKPEMIAEATARAREAAEQFAGDSGSRLGGIRRANQGLFQILPRDQASGVTEESQLQKIVRVVSTVEYYLVN